MRTYPYGKSSPTSVSTRRVPPASATTTVSLTVAMRVMSVSLRYLPIWALEARNRSRVSPRAASGTVSVRESQNATTEASVTTGADTTAAELSGGSLRCAGRGERQAATVRHPTSEDRPQSRRRMAPKLIP